MLTSFVLRLLVRIQARHACLYCHRNKYSTIPGINTTPQKECRYHPTEVDLQWWSSTSSHPVHHRRLASPNLRRQTTILSPHSALSAQRMQASSRHLRPLFPQSQRGPRYDVICTPIVTRNIRIVWSTRFHLQLARFRGTGGAIATTAQNCQSINNVTSIADPSFGSPAGASHRHLSPYLSPPLSPAPRLSTPARSLVEHGLLINICSG